MATRRVRPNLDEIDPNATPIPGMNAPPGTRASVRTTISYDKTVDPDSDERAGNGYSLDELAAAEAGNLEAPDPLTEFVEQYENFVGYNLMLLRIPDAAHKRLPGQTYVRPNFTGMENLGTIPFELNPASLIQAMQFANGNSGGTFKIWLIDQLGRRALETPQVMVTIADPPQQPRRARYDPDYDEYRPRYAPPAQPTAPPQKTEVEILKDDLFHRVMLKALDDKPAPVAQLSGEDNAALFLFKQTDYLSTMFSKMKDLSQTVENPGPSSWRERLTDAAVGLATSNPQVLGQVSSIIERIVARIFPNPNTTQPAPVNQPAPRQQQFQPAPIQQPPSTFQPLPIQSGLPQFEAPPSPEDIENDEMEIIEEIITLLSNTEPLDANSPVFVELRKEYPVMFPAMVQIIAVQPLDAVVSYIAGKSDLFDSLLNPATPGGQHLRKRLGELQALCQAAIQAQQPATQQPENGE